MKQSLFSSWKGILFLICLPSFDLQNIDEMVKYIYNNVLYKNYKGGNKMKKVGKLVSAVILIIIFIMSLTMISTAEGKAIIYKSKISYNFESFPSRVYSYVNKVLANRKYKNLYFIIDNYDLYKYVGFSGKYKDFFNDNLLIINCIMNGNAINNYKNTDVEIKDSVLNVYYTFTRGPRYAPAITYAVDVIELKKSDVNGVDLTKEVVNIKEGNIMSNTYDIKYHDYTKQMKYINLEKLIKKPEQVIKVKAQSPKKKQLKVTWKKIKGTKYQVQYSLKKNMKKAKLKNTKKIKLL